jgi:hypothetical protein
MNQLQQPRERDAYNILKPFVPMLIGWIPIVESNERYQSRLKHYFNFSAEDLIAYLKEHPDTCRALLLNSYDKRWTPSTFIEEWHNNQYRVGWVPSGENAINQIRVFSDFTEATADYVLFSWKYPRLTKEQAKWFEMKNYR